MLGRAGGFTLLEVLVAFVVIAATLGAVYSLIGQGTRGLAAADERLLAAAIADSELARATMEAPLVAGAYESMFDQRLRVRTRVAPYSELVERLKSAPIAAFLVEVTVTRVGNVEPIARVATIRLAPRQGPARAE